MADRTNPILTKARIVKILSMILVTVEYTRAAPTSETEWWLNPCSSPALRQVRSTADKELNYFITMNRQMYLELKELYPKNLKKIRGNCPKLNKLISPVRDSSDVTTAHQNFYRSMVEFAVYLERLRVINIKTNVANIVEQRQIIYNKTQNIMKLTLCEFNETLIKQMKVPNMMIQHKKPIRTSCIPKEADLSRVEMLDLQFFDKLKRFFKQGKRVLKDIKRKRKASNKVKKPKKNRTKQ